MRVSFVEWYRRCDVNVLEAAGKPYREGLYVVH